MIPYTIRAYSGRDDKAAYELWQAALGDVWPTTKEAFHRVLSEHLKPFTENCLVAERGEKMLGLVALQTKKNATNAKMRGSIPLIMVAPEARRQGIGTALLDAALDQLQECYARSVQLGAGGASYFWQGVPECLPEAAAFFRARGWEFSETSFDLLRDLGDYETPPELLARVAALGVTIRLATCKEMAKVVAFERQAFPEWADYFAEELNLFPVLQGGLQPPSNVLAARDREGNIIGTLLLFTADSGGSQAKLWKPMLGENLGGLGAVGVAEKWRGLGVGTALTARATEILKERGVRNSHIGWTWLLDFYGRLGYKPWRSFLMSRRELYNPL